MPCVICKRKLTDADIFYNSFVCSPCFRSCKREIVRFRELETHSVFRVQGDRTLNRVTSVDDFYIHFIDQFNISDKKYIYCNMKVEKLIPCNNLK